MPPIQQHILNWLYSVLTSEYHDVNRTYGDVAQALSQYPSLSPRTDVHTFDNGTSALLLHITGTLPVIFRGTTYRFPLSIRVPYAYPLEAPLIYVTPTEHMVVRPGQHVDPQGQVYHPYLAGWSTFWDKSTLVDFLTILRDVFAKEPPVIARQPSHPVPPSQQTQPLQRLTDHSVASTHELAGRPSSQPPVAPTRTGPPPPPKDTDTRLRGLSQFGSERPHDAPLPPPIPAGLQDTPELSHTYKSHRQSPSRYDSAPPLPGQPTLQNRPFPLTHSPLRTPATPPYVRSSLQYRLGQASSTVQPSVASFQPSPVTGPSVTWQARENVQVPAKPNATPQPDLLDEPLTLSIPLPSSLPAPPIPPNPEKDALLRQLAQTLYSLRQQSRQQNESSMAGLQAQRKAMMSASSILQSEISALDQTSALLSSNANILRDALRKADIVVEGSRQQTTPDIDELLVAPTVVSNQLYALVAEERAMGDAIFVLGRAVERGRISPVVFAKTTRSLAREWYLKKALVRKIGRGMGLVG
ncbi:ESCRT-I component [Verticillium alfalfae VaMs.102]|uniref:ESCRT-I component n=1 Tax=Verticillium alfalfae (strain VaMs.102 / ATCC MYA-4576 / FGSC 10136) TaxID=526221 RepID=C9SGY4_VERA1|nr:ESCRT-I component [Verticillium alfalfae VaMs.102]EEY18204.1 ESCRT-I component [Verticillium alfalfae VaMs.102]